jgi:hypothetical protein
MEREEFLGYYIGDDCDFKKLTNGKIYEFVWEPQMIYSSDGIYYETINDVGGRVWVYYTHIKRLDKVREEKIDEIIC